MQLTFGLILAAIIVLAAVFSGLYVNKQPVELEGNRPPRKLPPPKREQFLKLVSEIPAGTVKVKAIRRGYK